MAAVHPMNATIQLTKIQNAPKDYVDRESKLDANTILNNYTNESRKQQQNMKNNIHAKQCSHMESVPTNNVP